VKIYFVYRSAYESISRYMKVFEANSILEWFQTHWDILSIDDDNLIELFGLYVYGFPIREHPIPLPQSIEDLINKLEKHVYLNELKGTEHCIEVSTDDDEIGLAWYIFDEFFVQNNPEKTTFWLTKELPTNFGDTGQLLGDDKLYGEVLPKGNYKGCLYLGLVSDTDTWQFDFPEGLMKIENIRLPDFLDYLSHQTISFEQKKSFDSGFRYLKLLQFLVLNFPQADIKEIIENFCKLSLPDLSEDLDEETVNKISEDLYKEKASSLKRFTPLSEYQELMLEYRGECFKPFISVNEHVCEWGDIFVADFYNYFVIFDDLWVEKNKLLAENVSRFFKSEWL
jgi:hypothetical protein